MAFGKSRAEAPLSAFDEAERRFRKIDDAMAAAVTLRERKAVARSLAANPGDAGQDRTAWARKFAGDLITAAKRRPDRLDREILDLDEAIDDMRAERAAARAEWEHQRSVRTSEIAISLQGRQRQVVARLSKILESLSETIDDARAINVELAQRAPLPTSVYLPSVTDELAPFACLGNHLSAASRWAQRMKQIGILPR